MADSRTLASHRLETLGQSLAAGDTEAVGVFWQDVAELGTPLVENIEGDDAHRLVTFLWRGSSVGSVAIISLMTEPNDNQMMRLPDSDVWYKTVRLRNDIRATYQFLPDAAPDIADRAPGERYALMQPDPLNRHTFALFDVDEDPTESKLIRSVVELPAAPPQPWIEAQDGIPRGKVELHHFRSALLGNERRTWVYTPPGYSRDKDEAYRLLILFDGWAYLKLIPTPTILDNLLADGRLAPVVAVMLDSLSLETRLRELVFHDPFNDFLVTELAAWLRANYHVTSDPARTAIGGSSAGGLAAAYAALKHPEVFGNVLSQSGAFSLTPEGYAEDEWLARQFADGDRLPLSFYLDTGILETNSLRAPGACPSPLVANRHLRDVLRAKGYPIHYAEFPGGHDYISWRGTLADGLQALFGIS